MFTFIFIAILCIFIYITSHYIKRSMSDIIKIRDIEMMVSNKYVTRDYDINHTNYHYDYHIDFQGVENSNKRGYSTSRRIYNKYNIGDIVTMQEVIYKYRDEVYSDIVFASKSHYEKEQRFRSKYKKDINLYNDEYIDIYIDQYHEEKSNKLDTFKALFIPIGVLLFIFVAISISNILDKTGYTLSYMYSDPIKIEGSEENYFGIDTPTPKDFPKANTYTASKKEEVFVLEALEDNKYIIINHESNKVTYKINGELKEFKREKIPENHEINYNKHSRKNTITITTKVIHQYNQLSNDEFSLLTNEEIELLEPTSVEKEVYYNIRLTEPKQIKYID